MSYCENNNIIIGVFNNYFFIIFIKREGVRHKKSDLKLISNRFINYNPMNIS